MKELPVPSLRISRRSSVSPEWATRIGSPWPAGIAHWPLGHRHIHEKKPGTGVAGNLPTGSCDRVEIARAIRLGPELLLLDEPAAGMEPRRDRGSWRTYCPQPGISGASRSCSSSMTSPGEGVADRAFVLDFGEVIASGSGRIGVA